MFIKNGLKLRLTQEEAIVLEKNCRIALNLRLRQKMKFSQNIFYIWNVFSSKREKFNVVEEFFRIA